MKSVVPPVDGARWERSSDDLDELLRAYFRSRLPEPWPQVKLPRTVPAARSRVSLWSSRFALAATIAFLLIGSLAITAVFRGSPAPPGAVPPTVSADRDPLHLTAPEPDKR